MKKLTVIIPCYNESQNLSRGVLTQVYGYLSTVKFSYEVLICDDGSTDDSRELVKKAITKMPGFKLLALPHGGKPSALRGGIKAATGDILLFADMDQSTPLPEIEKLLPWFDRGFDVVIGSRGLKRAGFPWWRQIASVVFRLVRGLFVLPQIIDTQCGFKAIKTPLAGQIFSRLSYFASSQSRSGWSVSAYDAEMLYIADKWGKKIKEIPVEWQDEDTSTTKNRGFDRFFKESVKMAKEVSNILICNQKGLYRQP